MTVDAIYGHHSCSALYWPTVSDEESISLMVSQHSTNYWRSVSWCLSWLAADMLTECCLGLGWQVPTVYCIVHMIQLGLCLEENNTDSWCNPNGLAKIDSSCCLNCHSWKPKIHNIPIGHFQVPKTFTFKMRPNWVLLAWEWKIIFIQKAEHLTTFWYRGQRKHRNGLLIFVLWVQWFWVWNLRYDLFGQVNQYHLNQLVLWLVI